MNERIRELAELAGLAEAADVRVGYIYPAGMEKFAELIIEQCIKTLEFHGFDEAVPYIKWMAKNKL